MEESTDVGPLIRESDAIRVTNWIGRGRALRRPPAVRRWPQSFHRQPDVLTGTKPDYEGELSGNFWSVVTVERTRILMKPCGDQ